MSLLSSVKEFIGKNAKMLVIAGGALFVGIGISGAAASILDYTNSLGFCANTCHEMHDTVYQEYTHSKHFKNPQGVVVVCADCHVPKHNWPKTFAHKFLASFELYDHFIGGESDPKVFSPKRAELSKKVLASFKATNAAACKNCHKYENMLLEEQRPSIRAQHEDAKKTDENCLDCHQGITHHKYEDPSAATGAGKAAADSFDIQ